MMGGQRGCRLAAAADEWQLPPAVAAYFAEIDAAGRAAAGAASFWAEAKADPQWEPDPSVDHRASAPMHFVQGRSSPWYIEGMRQVL